MAVTLPRRKLTRLSKKSHNTALCCCLATTLQRIPVAIFVLVFIYIWSSTTSVFSTTAFHLCLSSRKFGNLYCLSAATHPGFEIPAAADQVPTLTRNDSGSTHANGSMEWAFQEVEAQLEMHRSWAGSARPTSCHGRGIYVYELPPEFNHDLVAQCRDMIPWLDFCKFLGNGAMGETIETLGRGWYNTHQYALEPIFHARVLTHRCRVRDPNQAKVFYVPYYGGLDILRWHFKNVTDEVKDALGLDLVRWLESQAFWYRNSGEDHVFVLGKISWDFRRGDGSSWGSSFLQLDQMQNPVKLLIERQPWHANDIGIPHPTYFHPKTDDDIIAWQIRVITSTRRSLVSFAGAARPDSADSIRTTLIQQCTSAGDGECRFLNCSSGQCDRPESIVNVFLESDFCLQPPGDSPTRKSVFDSLVSGCIPVVFDPFTAYYQYPWHLPKEGDRYSVFIDKEENGSVMERLRKISEKEREKMRKYIVYEVFPGLVYGDPNSRFEKFDDAFAISMNNLVERTTRMKF